MCQWGDALTHNNRSNRRVGTKRPPSWLAISTGRRPGRFCNRCTEPGGQPFSVVGSTVFHKLLLTAGVNWWMGCVVPVGEEAVIHQITVFVADIVGHFVFDNLFELELNSPVFAHVT
jgi:hypothetical protein